MPKTPTTKYKYDQYIADVVSGKQVVSDAVKQQIERHLSDLDTGASRNLRFDPSHANHVIDFVQSFCKHSQGCQGRSKSEPVRRSKREPLVA